MSVVPKMKWPYEVRETRDGLAWSALDIEQLTIVLMNGGSIDDAAELLCREGTKHDVRRKAKELWLLAD